MYDEAARDKIRTALDTYMKENRLGTPKMEELTHVPHRTIHRFLAGIWVNDGAVQLIERYLERLPHKPLLLQAFGDALHKLFNHAPDSSIGGVYRVLIADVPVSELTIKLTGEDDGWYQVSERSTGVILRSYEGSLVFTGTAMIAVLRDRMMKSARVHMLHLNAYARQFYGLVYDDGPLERGALSYQLLQTTLEKIEDAV
jgi:hypothetical protein